METNDIKKKLNIYDETIGKGNAPYFVMSEEDGLISINDYIKKLD